MFVYSCLPSFGFSGGALAPKLRPIARMNVRILTAIFTCLVFAAVPSMHAAEDSPGNYAPLKEQAEKLYEQRSFAKAHDVYVQAAGLNLSAEDKRWVEFRLADTQWRSEASSQAADTTKLDQALHQLEVLVRDVARVEEHDRVWVEVKESLADYHWTRR